MIRKAKRKPALRLPLKEPILRPTFRRERRALNKGVFPVAGCDEAGRGPLAGPVVAAAVVLDPSRIPRGLNDSKKLDAAAREKLYEKICATAQVAVAFGAVERIDRDNILRASLWALARAVKALPVRPKLVFVDGNQKIDCGCDCEAVVSGDALVLSVAAASIVAKVTRDRLMTRLGLAHPGYGFERHMGYSVPEHFAALAKPRTDHPPPEVVCAGRRQTRCHGWHHGRRLGRGHRAVVASLARLLYCCPVPTVFTRPGPMHYVSLLIEFLRGRPAVVFWTVALTQAALWTFIPAIFFSAPPGDVPMLLAIGHEFVLGSYLGPPLAFWLGEIAFGLGGSIGSLCAGAGLHRHRPIGRCSPSAAASSVPGTRFSPSC